MATLMDGWNDFEKRMYFYAYKRVHLSTDDIAEWRRLLPAAMEMQYIMIDNGSLPMILTLEKCRELSSKFHRDIVQDSVSDSHAGNCQ
jgi:hypothetical protein